MLREDAPEDNTNPECTNPRSFVHIIEITEVFANPFKFAASKYDVVDKTFTDMLAGSPVAEGAVIRLIAVEYSRPQDLNFAFIDAIGHHLKINPNMFFLHFERSRELYAEKTRNRVPGILPLDPTVLHFEGSIDGSGGSFVTASIVDNPPKDLRTGKTWYNPSESMCA